MFPLKKNKVCITSNSNSFKNKEFTNETEIPIESHVGAFSTKRKNHKHEGVDLYCNDGDEVFVIEDGVIVLIEHFTGEKAKSPWWNDTQAIHIESVSGVIVYGEIIVNEELSEGMIVKEGDLIGNVRTVLKKDKGRPMSMLHVELYKYGSRESVEWHPWINDKPEMLLNPTALLIREAIKSNIL